MLVYFLKKNPCRHSHTDLLFGDFKLHNIFLYAYYLSMILVHIANRSAKKYEIDYMDEERKKLTQSSSLPSREQLERMQHPRRARQQQHWQAWLSNNSRRFSLKEEVAEGRMMVSASVAGNIIAVSRSDSQLNPHHPTNCSLVSLSLGVFKLSLLAK